jgi:SOS-response transcriptional repressor LexA
VSLAARLESHGGGPLSLTQVEAKRLAKLLKRKRSAELPACTDAQLRVLKEIRQCWERHNTGPLLIEIATALGAEARSTAHEHLAKLRAKGLVTCAPYSHRDRRLTPLGEEVLGG